MRSVGIVNTERDWRLLSGFGCQDTQYTSHRTVSPQSKSFSVCCEGGLVCSSADDEIFVIPQVASAKQETMEVDATAQSVETSGAGTPGAEIPYIPASQRQTGARTVVDDSIVVVGQTKQKKRKRPKVVSQGGGGGGGGGLSTPEDDAEGNKRPVKAGDDDDVLEPFDFSTVPNILDDVPQLERESKQRKKKQKRHDGEIFSTPVPFLFFGMLVWNLKLVLFERYFFTTFVIW